MENATPRRTSEGFSRNRLNIILAVLEKKCKLAISYKDVFTNIVGGLELESPSADLGVAMALYSSDKNISIDPQTVIMGEIGLTGEVRPVANIEQLVKESEKVGFKKVILPKANYERIEEMAKKMKIKFIPVDTVNAAINALFPATPKAGK
jgi:DNA repair protein RadA/Sms